MTSASGLRWRWDRLRAMPPPEVAWRVADRLRSSWESRRAGREQFRRLESPAASELVAAFAESSRPLVPAPEWREELAVRFPEARARLEGVAQAAARGRVTLFAREYQIGADVAWHLDPGTGVAAPSLPARAIDYRDRSLVGSARRTWELNRHHHLAETALWAWAARDRAAGRLVVEQLVDWCHKNPPHWGINWTSSLELAVRSLAWAEILALLVDVQEPALDDPTLALLLGAWARQIEHVRAHDSRYSSANNHRMGEACAVAAAGTLLPFHPRAADWREWGFGALEHELVRQIAPDGVGREQALAYQRFVIDFAVLACALGRGRGIRLADAAMLRLRAACAFLDAATRPDGTTFAIGDDDEGRALALGESFEERTEATLESAGWLLDEPRWRRSAYARSRWLGLAREPAAEIAARPGRCEGECGSWKVGGFAEGGYGIAAGRSGALPVRALFDAGPLGFPPLAAHGHADALGLCLWMGEDLLIDPGTGSYHGDPDWRELLRGTGAHNTCAIDDRDQSERRGLFLWGRHARPRLAAAGGQAPYFVFAGRHDGYARFGVPEVRRLVIGWIGEQGVALLVADEALGRGEHTLSVPWHLGAGEPEAVEHGTSPLWRAGFPRGATLWARARLLAPEASHLIADTASGGDVGTGGWYAPRFEERAPEGRIRARACARLPASLVWLLFATPPAAGAGPLRAPVLEACAGGASGALELGGGRRLRALVAHPTSPLVEDGHDRLEGRAALWMESPADTADMGPGALAGVVGATAFGAAAGLAWRSGGAPVSGVLAMPGQGSNDGKLSAAGPTP